MELAAKALITNEMERKGTVDENKGGRNEFRIEISQAVEPSVEQDPTSTSPLSLPPEILIQILLSLSPSDLLACKLTNRYLHDLIQDSVEVQYHSALFSFGAEDNPRSSLPITEKLRVIRNTERAWSLVESDFTSYADVPNYPAKWYDIMDGVFFWSDSASSSVNYLRLPEKEDDEVIWRSFTSDKWIIAFTASLYEHDLITLVTTTPVGQDEDGRVTYSMELHLLEFSTGKPHPKARDSHILLMNTCLEEPIAFIQVVGEYFTFICSIDNGPEDCIIVLNWQTNELKMNWFAPRGNYLGHRFLTEDLIVFVNKRDISLDIFRIPSKPDLTTPTPILVLNLPQVADGYVVDSFHLCVKPTPRSAPLQGRHHDEYDRKGSIPTRSYFAKAEDAIFIFRIQISSHCFTFIVHRNSLINLVEKYGSPEEDKRSENPNANTDDANPPKGDTQENNEENEKADGTTSSTPMSQATPTSLPYSFWGPDITRWFSPRRYVMVLTTWGQKHVQMGSNLDGRGAPILVLDFNPARVERFKSESKEKERVIETESPDDEEIVISADNEGVPRVNDETALSSPQELILPSEMEDGENTNSDKIDMIETTNVPISEEDQDIPPQTETSPELVAEIDANDEESVQTWCVSSLDRVEPAEVFAEPVWTGLPYVASASKTKYTFNDVIMDEERILGLRKDFWGFVDGIDILHIG